MYRFELVRKCADQRDMRPCARDVWLSQACSLILNLLATIPNFWPKKTKKILKHNLTLVCFLEQSTKFVLSPEVAQSLPSSAAIFLQIAEC